MIIVKFSGGLGNQLYQYALMRKLQALYPQSQIKADISFYTKNNVHNGFEVAEIFHIPQTRLGTASFREQFMVRCEIPYEGAKQYPVFLEKPTAWLNARMRYFFQGIGLRNEIMEEVHVRDNIYKKENSQKLAQMIQSLDIKKNWYFNGYWQNEVFFEDILPDIIRELQFPDFQEKGNIELEETVQKGNSVSIHIRRGDYVNSKYDILHEDYYKKAAAYITERVKKPMWYVFSDDAEYALNVLDFLKNKVIISHNSGGKSWCDLKLMSLCKHNILANSSFSNWGGYFNKNRNKIVIYPSQYTESEMNSRKTGEGWVKIDV